MQNKENSNNSEMFLAGWERGLLSMKSEVSWMRKEEEYGATDVELELEAALKLINSIYNRYSLKAEKNNNPELLNKMKALMDFATSVEKMPARLSLNKKFVKCNSERMKNVEIS